VATVGIGVSSREQLQQAEQEAEPRKGKQGRFKIVKFKDFLDEEEVSDVDVDWLASRDDVKLIYSGHITAPGRLDNGEVAAAIHTDKGTVGVVGWEVEL
jgi:hypothetical protein